MSAVAPVAAVARAQGTTHLHLTRRGRVVFTTLAAAPLVVGALLLAFAVGTASAVAEGAGAGHAVSDSFRYVTVQAGQSLWRLAETVAPSADPRDVIAAIVSLNQLSSENVQPGQRLALPTEY